MKKLTIKVLSIALSLFLCIPSTALAFQPADTLKQKESYPQVGIPNTEERALDSKIMDYEYGVYVTLPGSYKDNPDKIYPTLYIVDGNQFFVFTHEPYGSLIWGNMVKEHIAISVAYRPGQVNNRSKDFYSSRRASDFVEFFQEELIPFVEDNYRTSSVDRTLFGHSLGGHFTIYMMMNAHETFDNYILSAPSVNADILKYEEEFASTHEDFPAKVFLASGENDNLTINAKKFAENFKSRAYPNLKFDELYTINGNHGTVQPTAYIEGLRFVLDPVVELSVEKFGRLTGTYESEDITYTVSYEGGNFLSLDIQTGGEKNWYTSARTEWKHIYPVSETSFVSKGWTGNFEFGGKASSPAESFEFKNRDHLIKAKRKL